MTSGSRLLLRVARRDARAHKRRSLLIVALIGVPVAAMAATLTLARSAERTPEQQRASIMGQADVRVRSFGVPPAEWQPLLPGSARWTSQSQEHHSVALVSNDELFEPQLLLAELGHPLLSGRAELVSGRAARAEDEVVVSPSLARALGVTVGDRLKMSRPDRTVSVVGTAEMPFSLGESWVFAPPDWKDQSVLADGSDPGVEWLIDTGGTDPSRVITALGERFPSPYAAGTGLDETVPLHAEVFDSADRDVDYLHAVRRTDIVDEQELRDTGVLASATYVAGGLALVWTGSVAAAAFAVGARRRQREVGLVAACGGAPVHLRRLLLADGLVLGAAGALGGVVAGVTLAAAVLPHLDRLVGHVVDDLRVPLLWVVGAAAVGWLAAVVAAVVPARSAARVPVLSALAGVRPNRAGTRSWLILGLVALALGVPLTWVGGRDGQEPAVNVGVLLVVFGVAATTGPLFGGIGRLATTLPLSLRLAARDAARSRSRGGPATVAAMLALAGAVGGSTMYQSNEAEYGRVYVPYLQKNQLRVSFDDDLGDVSANETDLATLVAAARRAVPGAVAGILARVSAGPDGDGSILVDEPEPSPGGAVDLSSLRTSVAVGDVGTVEAFDAPEAIPALEAGHVVALNGGTVDDDGTVTLRRRVDGRVERLATLPAVQIEGTALQGSPNYLISSKTAEDLGLRTVGMGAIVAAPRPATDADVRRVDLAVAEALPTVAAHASREVGPTSGSSVLRFMLGAGALVALFVVGLVTALSREELRPHLAILAAVGASPSTRRRLAAAQSGLIGAMASLLALPGGLIPAVTLLRARSGGRTSMEGNLGSSLGDFPIVVPWLAIAVLVVVVTLLSAAGGGTFTRTRSA